MSCLAEIPHPSDQGHTTPHPILSAIIPTYGRQEMVMACIEALRCASEPPNEIVVVDDGSPNGLQLPNDEVRLVRHSTNRGPGAARNTGAKVAKGEWLLFVDSDLLVSPDVPARVRRTFTERPEVALVGGVYTEDCPHKEIISTYKNLYWRHKFLVLPPQTANINSAIMAIRREVFEAVGMFNEETLIGEDRELGNAVAVRGFQTFLDKGMLGTHCKQFSFWGLMKEHFTATVNATLLLLASPIIVRRRDKEVLGASHGFLASIAVAAMSLLTLLAGVLMSSAALAFLGTALVVLFVGLNFAFLRTCERIRGPGFALACLGLAFAEALVAFSAVGVGVVRFYLLVNPRRDFKLN